MATKTEPQKKQPNLHFNSTLPNLWIDSMSLAVREDNICVLRFFTMLPEGVFEQSRIMTDKNKLRGIADAICSSLNYYPTKNPAPPKGKKEPMSH